MTLESPLTRRDLLAVVLLVLAGLAIRLYFVQFYDVISSDGVAYVHIAQDFISGKGFAGATHYPPFFPILLGLASTLTGDFEKAGLAVSIVMGSLLALPVFLLGREFFDRRVGFIAAALSVSWPSLRFWSTAVMSQATYLTLLLFGMYLLWRAYQRESSLAAVLSGASFACAHLTRSEGVLVFFAQLAVLTLFNRLDRQSARRLLYLLTSLTVFFVVFSPYLVLLHQQTGKWELTGKSKIAIADALSMYLGRVDLKHDPAFQELGYLDLFRQYPDYLRVNYLRNLKKIWTDLLPLFGWLLAGIGLLGGLTREKYQERAFLLASFAPLVVIVVFFFVGPEYTQAYLPVLFLFLGHGAYRLLDWLNKLAGVAPLGGLSRWTAVLPVLPVLLAMVWAGWLVISAVPADRDIPYSYTKDEGRYDEKRIGLKLAQVLPPGAPIMTRSGRIGFYSGHPYVMPPQGDFTTLVAAARRDGIQFLVATPQLVRMRPQFEFLLRPIEEPQRPLDLPPSLEFIAIDELPGGIPFILYRFH